MIVQKYINKDKIVVSGSDSINAIDIDYNKLIDYKLIDGPLLNFYGLKKLLKISKKYGKNNINCENIEIIEGEDKFSLEIYEGLNLVVGEYASGKSSIINQVHNHFLNKENYVINNVYNSSDVYMDYNKNIENITNVFMNEFKTKFFIHNYFKVLNRDSIKDYVDCCKKNMSEFLNKFENYRKLIEKRKNFFDIKNVDLNFFSLNYDNWNLLMNDDEISSEKILNLFSEDIIINEKEISSIISYLFKLKNDKNFYPQKFYQLKNNGNLWSNYKKNIK